MSELGQELLSAVEKAFTAEFGKDRMISKLRRKIENGSGTWADAEAYAARLGELKSRALLENITAAVLPEGRMDYTLAWEILTPALKENYELALEAAATVQESLNEAAGIGMRAVRPELNQDRIEGMVDRIGAAENFEDISWMLGEPVVNFTQSVADDTLEENIEFHVGAGLSPKIIRIAEGGCCKWCAELEGEWDYDNKPHDIYRRHENCRCQVLYSPVKGQYTDVHTKKQADTETDKRIERVEALRANKERDDQGRRDIRQRISDGTYSLKIQDQKYAEHVYGTPQYLSTTQGRGIEPSRLTISKEEAQQIILRYSGTGDPQIYRSGVTGNVEYITYKKPVGQIQVDGQWVDTHRVAITHAKDGTHIYPVKPRS